MSITAEDIMRDPNKYGVPTIHQFARNPEKYFDSNEDRMGRIDKSSELLKDVVEKQWYKLGKWKVDSLEKIERIAKEEGIDLANCKLCPQIVPSVAGKCDIIVEFKPKLASRILDMFGRNIWK